MARQKTNKTAIKRVHKTNPKGNRKAKMMIKPSAQHHLKTKRSRRTKRRKNDKQSVSKSVANNFERVIINIK